MRTTVMLASLSALLAAWALVGCKDKAKELSSSRHLLALQHKVWRNARQTLTSKEPNLNLLTAAGSMVCARTRRRVEKDYDGPNKAALIAKLNAIGAAYAAQVITKLETTETSVRLKPGVTLDQVRKAFAEVDKDYRELEAMTTGIN